MPGDQKYSPSVSSKLQSSTSDFMKISSNLALLALATFAKQVLNFAVSGLISMTIESPKNVTLLHGNLLSLASANFSSKIHHHAYEIIP